MRSANNNGPLDSLIKALGGMPGLGPRSARRIALHLLTNKEKTMLPLINALTQTAENIRTCHSCGNLDLTDPCRICNDETRSDDILCVVAGVADLWAIERTAAYKGRYHILGGVLSALDGIRPADLRITELLARVEENQYSEVLIALGATVDGQATGHYLTDKLQDIFSGQITRLAHGVPVGGELDYLDDGTITTALKSRARV
jgi:recombination protein RecR